MTDPGDTLCDYLEAAARRCPDAVAVRFRDRSISYRELAEQSDGLAGTLADAGVGTGDRVGIWSTKSIESVVAVHAVLKLGAAYVPIDPIAPVKRATYLLRDCGVRALVTTREHQELLDDHALSELGLSLVVLADCRVAPAPARPVRRLGWSEATATRKGTGPRIGPVPEDLAYILYTSGSTGAPKGVMLSHRNGRVFADWALRRFGVTGDDRLAGHAPLHFDLSIFDLFAAAGAGACLVLVPEHRQSLGQALNRFVLEERITIWYSVPNVLTRMLAAANESPLARSALRVVLFAGEVFPIKHLRRLRRAVPDADLYNLYGPTETNVCTFHQVGDADLEPDRTRPVPIGRGCDYATTVLVDESGKVLDGTEVEGELCVGGDSVMLGYWGDQAKTRERLVLLPGTDRFDDRGPVYRTGDVVRRDARGDLVFVGRRDHMVKIRGYRVELGEIEAVLLGHADVGEAAVVAVPESDGTLRLEACVRSRAASGPTEPELRRHCLEALPRYLLPARIHLLESLPLTSTGKIDRPALTTALEAPAGPRP
ncbi:amino acid adenylation domain-containing protein [Amycolatopsis nigrescens]|uniref:amino acid adenylation domain-containing protein n=1 Tax=Amycolatopsis nigrescens TaxID=381445 RepID=UPI0003815B95|nr:amino acid adenylation domain-containing protein [Amycolatopsis nigrescens]